MNEDIRFFSQSEAFDNALTDELFLDQLLASSNYDEQDAENRLAVYSDVMNQFDDLMETQMAFSGMSEFPLLSNQYFNASMASYVRAFTGFCAIERSMDQPTALLWYNDLLGVVDNRTVIPNIGKEDLSGINARFSTKSSLTQGQDSYQISTNKKLIPGSIELNIIIGTAAPIVVKDDRNGNLLAPAGVLASTTQPGVNYINGVISFKLSQETLNKINPSTPGSFTVIGFEDVAGDPIFGQLSGPGNNRFKVDMKNITVHSEPDMLVGESNLMAIAASKKAIGVNPQDLIGQKLTELYTKLVNEKQVANLKKGAQGNEIVIPMGVYQTKFTDYNSRLDAFQANLVDIDTAMAKRTYKATKATAYFVGEELGNWFRKTSSTGAWTDNTESTYVNDLLGYFKGVPVFRHIDIDPKEGYAVHKTPGGEVAPIIRGIYLPLTNMPTVGNYNNPSQFVNGVYYQEANELLYPELIQKFRVDNQEPDAYDYYNVKQVGA